MVIKQMLACKDLSGLPGRQLCYSTTNGKVRFFCARVGRTGMMWQGVPRNVGQF